MSLLDDLNREEAIPKGPSCSLSKILGVLPTEDAELIQGAVAGSQPRPQGGRYSATAIARVLKGLGHQIDASTINRHRRSECQTCAEWI